jgi:SOS-response transcriptional repressor LexA
MAHFLRTQTIYNYILQCRDQDDFVPTMREIAHACQVPLATVFRHLDWLEARGYLRRNHTTRSIRILKPFLTDEEQVYTCLVHSIKVSALAPSLNMLHEASNLPLWRIKAALHLLAKTGRIQPDADNPHRFHPTESDS